MADIIISRADAQTQGLTRYFTGKPCRLGHVAERMVSTKACLTCKTLRERGEAFLAGQRRSYARHREAKLASSQAYYAANRAWVLSRQKRYQDANKERVAIKSARWAKANPEKMRAKEAMRRALKLAGGTYTSEDILALGVAQSWLCAAPWCRKLILGAYEVDHIMPLIRGGTNDPSNLQLLCMPCNREKGAKHPDEWLARRPAPS